MPHRLNCHYQIYHQDDFLFSAIIKKIKISNHTLISLKNPVDSTFFRSLYNNLQYAICLLKLSPTLHEYIFSALIKRD